MTTATDSQLHALGALIRARRRELGRSLREVARAAGVSSSYLGAIESGRNPATGRPPLPSLRVLAALARELGLELGVLLASVGLGDETGDEPAHTLLYVLDGGRAGVLDHVARLHADTERWVHVPDPRDAGEQRAALTCAWPLGTDPYPDHLLDPDRVVAALERELRAGAERLGEARTGLLIADCSAVMRWVTNPEDELAFEHRWPDDVERIFRAALGRPPTANVCVYRHDDIEALALQVDPLAIGLSLLRTHTAVALLLGDGTLLNGTRAAREILLALKPVGVRSATWAHLCAAAAVGLAAR
jgi:transcriptional regulator with XRE-family HTH domain